MPTAFSRTSRRSFGSALPWRSHHSRVIGGATSRIARRADLFITLASARSWKTGRMSARSVWSQPAQPWRVGSMPSLASQRYTGRCRQFSRRWKYRRMRAARQEGSPVSAAMPSQSASWGTRKISALCAVQPPRAAARGYSTPSTFRPFQVSRYLGSSRCRASAS